MNLLEEYTRARYELTKVYDKINNRVGEILVVIADSLEEEFSTEDDWGSKTWDTYKDEECRLQTDDKHLLIWCSYKLYCGSSKYNEHIPVEFLDMADDEIRAVVLKNKIQEVDSKRKKELDKLSKELKKLTKEEKKLLGIKE